MKYPEWYLHCVCSANCVAFLQVPQLCFHNNVTSAPLLSSSSKCSGILWLYCYHSLQCCSISSQQVFCAQNTLLSVCSHGSIPSRQPSVVSLRSCLPPCAVISRLLCCSCSVHDIWLSAVYVCFLMSFPIVFSLNYPASPPVEILPSLLECHPWKPISILSRCFFSPSHLFSIYSPFGQRSWSLTKHSFQSLKNALHS